MATQQMPDSSKENVWGMIYCPRESTKKRWEKIKRYLDEKGQKYDYVQSDGSGSIERLAEMMVRNGYRTIVVVGGDSALNHALNGLLQNVEDEQELPVLGVIPNGHVNDFASYWDFVPNDYKSTIDRLVKHRVRRIDVGKVRIQNRPVSENESFEPVTTAYFLNSVNIGTAASIIHRRRQAQTFGYLSTVSYVFAVLQMLFQRMNFNFDFTVHSERFQRRGMTLCVGSARGYGQTPSAVPYNGLLDVSLVTPPQLTQLFHGLWLLLCGRFLSLSGINVWRTKCIEFHDVDGAKLSYDSHVYSSRVESVYIEVLPEKIAFLI